jgi:host cell factor
VYLFGGLANDSDDPKVNIPRYLNDLYALDLKSTPNGLQWSVPSVCSVGVYTLATHYFTDIRQSTVGARVTHGGLLQSGWMQATVDNIRRHVRHTVGTWAASEPTSTYSLGDVWILDFTTNTWSNPIVDGIPPLPRSLHTANIVADQ